MTITFFEGVCRVLIYVNANKNIVISVTATFKPLVFDRVEFIQKYIERFIME